MAGSTLFINAPNLRGNLISVTSDLIDSREKQIRWLEKFIEDVKAHEMRVNVAKGVTTTTTVASTVMLFFPPTTILGAIGLAGSGVASAVTSLADFITNTTKSSELEDMVKQTKALEDRLQELHDELRSLVHKLAEDLGVDHDVALQLVFVEGIAKVAKNYYDVVNGVGRVLDLLPKVKQIQDVMKFGYGFLDAGRVASGTGLTMVVEEGVAVYQITGSAVSNLTKALSGVGAVISVADMVYSWANDNPNLASAKNCLEHVKKNKTDLSSSLTVYKNIPN